MEIESTTRRNILVEEVGSRNNSNEKMSGTMLASGAESVHVENKNPDYNGYQTREIEIVRKEKTIKKGSNNARRALLVGLTEEQKIQRR